MNFAAGAKAISAGGLIAVINCQSEVRSYSSWLWQVPRRLAPAGDSPDIRLNRDGCHSQDVPHWRQYLPVDTRVMRLIYATGSAGSLASEK